MLKVYEELGDTSRRMILSSLRSGPKSVGEICDSAKLKQPNVSNHLSRMRARGIVRAVKQGRNVYYGLASPEVEAIVNSVFNANTAPVAGLDWEELSLRYAKAAVQGDESACGEILDEAFRARTALIDIYQGLLSPAMALVGTWYKVEAIDEAQEHMASEITERMMARTSQITGPMRRIGKSAVLGCAAGSYHIIGLRMISDYLRLQGWRTLFLGANVPQKSFLTTVLTNEPHLVLLSCGAEESIQETLALVRELSRLRNRRLSFSIGVGGTAVHQYEDQFKEAGADFVARDLRSFAEEILPRMEPSRRAPVEAALTSNN
jgi:methanogenic corrinoid protein MtbC1